ncbi:MAG: hypothetical protein A2042_01530 [Candidatus Schekmanbacteria bacterium GWA2_38_11]|uniref:Uncharacterized protein n=1 Tax=Candidatus Schekmanbacteria bacterium GWA2_38_11 TaxID=1817876 RepID=A0A1F7RNZ0_9BACT|nr:MAG: hypothetical protein A2042_01530 [Candidatus Schekmanbacteria bacterium GWA2_38_11]
MGVSRYNSRGILPRSVFSRRARLKPCLIPVCRQKSNPFGLPYISARKLSNFSISQLPNFLIFYFQFPIGYSPATQATCLPACRKPAATYHLSLKILWRYDTLTSITQAGII